MCENKGRYCLYEGGFLRVICRKCYLMQNVSHKPQILLVYFSQLKKDKHFQFSIDAIKRLQVHFIAQGDKILCFDHHYLIIPFPRLEREKGKNVQGL